jgi:broad specificity phosphatase PhoE
MSNSYPSTTLLLIRHGQARANNNSYDQHTPLSNLGHQQATLVADALASRPVRAVYTSPFPRARETASPLCQRLRFQPITDSRLAEFDFGSKPFDVVQQRPDLVVWHPDHRGVEHGETLAAFSARVATFCNEVAERHVNECVAVFAHSGTIDAALRWGVGLLSNSVWQHEYDLATASITEIEYWPRGRVEGGAPRYAVLWRIGDVAHLGRLVSNE